MKRFLKSAVTISALSVLVAPVLLSAGQASAQPKGTNASYIGGGGAFGLTNGGQNGDAATAGGNITGRVVVPNTPISARASVLFGNETSNIIPEVSFDVPVTDNANVYLTGGYSFTESDGKPAPLGNKDAFVVGVGAEAEVAKDILVYGNTKLGINAYENSPASAVSVQVGGAYRFR